MADSPINTNALLAINRRQALGGILSAAAASAWQPRVSWAASPSEQLRVAAVGVGSQGRRDLNSVAQASQVKVVALCDVEEKVLGKAQEQFEKAKAYFDYRRMLDEMEGEIDAVIVGTPDHMHGPISLDAMSRGMHVYVEKPLTHNLGELRQMQELAAEKQLVTQMGTQIHSHEAYRTAVHLLREGTIGKVQEAHLWVARVWSGPEEGRPDRADAVPEDFHWDLWLGVAPERPYVEQLYHPWKWRGWRDFGAGTIGDMGCHLLDPLFTALELQTPMEAVSRGPQHREETFAPNSDLTLTFAGTPYTAEKLALHWTDGKSQRHFPADLLPADTELPSGGSLLIGDQGVMLLPHVGFPTFFRDGEVMEMPIESVGSRDHYHEWADACCGIGTTSTPFSYACPVTEAVLVGVVAQDFPGQALKWNSAELSFDHAPANQLIHRKHREEWGMSKV